MDHSQLVARELGLAPSHVAAVLRLLEDGNTVPFIARYRKEATGELDEVRIREIRDRFEYLQQLDERRRVILASIEEQGKLQPALRQRLEKAEKKSELEDLYRPFRPKRRTRAAIALERGLGPLAEALESGRVTAARLRAMAADLVAVGSEVESVDDALAGARDIVAERISEDSRSRALVRDLTWARGALASRAAKGKEDAVSKFRDYYSFSQPLRFVPGHRVLAIRRGEAEGFLSARIDAPEAEILRRLNGRYRSGHAAPEEIGPAIEDAYHRLIGPSVEAELRTEMKEAADAEAIGVFGQNLEGLLLAPPAGGRITLGVDPGFRTGCKLAVAGRTGELIETGVVYLHHEARALEAVLDVVTRCGVELIAIGNGTASRETQRLVKAAIEPIRVANRPVVLLVSEAGASVYSASDVAREEFPDLDLTLRSAISIARRVQDPLAELVKIDPKSIGVGQYQHDLPPAKLQKRLEETVESCVNRVGVEVNTASAALLGHVAGIGATLAHRIVAHRDSGGRFHARGDLRKVPGLGPKTFEQAAGFLRIRDARNPLDGSAVHPERYGIVERMAHDVGVPLRSLVGSGPDIARIDLAQYVDDDLGLPTLTDILDELRKPGRDPRDQFEAPVFREDVNELSDLREGMVLEGTVTNVVAFGAFVDLGVHQDGLVHVSQMADQFVSNPADVLSVGDRVTVRVLKVELDRRRIALTLRTMPAN